MTAAMKGQKLLQLYFLPPSSIKIASSYLNNLHQLICSALISLLGTPFTPAVHIAPISSQCNLKCPGKLHYPTSQYASHQEKKLDH